jgi:hypothetical protein
MTASGGIGHGLGDHHRQPFAAALDEDVGSDPARRLVVVDHAIDERDVVALVDEDDRHAVVGAFLAERCRR